MPASGGALNHLSAHTGKTINCNLRCAVCGFDFRQVVNATVRQRRYWPVVLASAAVIQEVSCVAASGAVPLHLTRGSLSAQALLTAGVVLLAAGVPRARTLQGGASHGRRLSSAPQG
jgi:hypothetical protein